MFCSYALLSSQFFSGDYRPSCKFLLKPFGEEKKSIDGADFVDNPDAMDLQVLVHPDQARQWKNIGGATTEEFLVPISFSRVQAVILMELLSCSNLIFTFCVSA